MPSRTLAFSLVASTLLTGGLFQLDLNWIESKLFDLRTRLGFHPKPSDEIVLVAVDDDAMMETKELSPQPVDIHAKFVETLEAARPKAVGYLVDMNRARDLNPAALEEGWGERFLRATRRLEESGTPFLFGTDFNVTGEVLPPFPLNLVQHAISILHKDGNVFGEDKVARRALTYLYDRPVFHSELAQRLGYVHYGKLPRGSFYVTEADAHFFLFRYHGAATSIEKGRDGSRRLGGYRYYSLGDFLAGRASAGELAGKIVLVGSLAREDSADFVLTPYSRGRRGEPKLVVHANILDSIIRDTGLVVAPRWVNALATFAVAATAIGAIASTTPAVGLAATAALAAFFALFAHLVFQAAGTWVRECEPLLAIFLVYYLTVPYRLILEYKRRWDYQRKNELLVQVEELKTNFLSLVTHDLKTPVARIQGLAEVLLRKASERLVERDRETVRHIIASTDELNRFISSILELSKIESSRLQLHLESKDVNLLIEQAAELFKPQARAQGKRISLSLEPLFPIRVDVSLISKVINNLIDNALKYSPDGSEIAVASRETGDWVEITVRDQGIGMTPEQKSRLFTKFFRVKSDQTMGVSGTGLGLYVTKYFIEAHRGRVEVDSERGKGSTFRILLPIGPAVAEAPVPDKKRWFPGLKTEHVAHGTQAPSRAPTSEPREAIREEQNDAANTGG